MDHVGYVIPLDNNTPGHEFEFGSEGELWAHLFGKIGAETIDCTPDVPTVDGPLRMWWDASTTAATNLRATAIAMNCGIASPLRGVVILTGPVDEDLGTVGLTDEQLWRAREAIERMIRTNAEEDARHDARMVHIRAISDQMSAAIAARDRAGVLAALREFADVSPVALLAGIVSVTKRAPDLLPDEL